jgi:peptide/nickel transport system substrate-binding protein
VPGLRWHDGVPSTARDAAFTLEAARDPATGYPRYADLADVREARALDDTTLAIAFARAQPRFPLVLCELPIVPVHLLDTVPRARMRQAAFSVAPVGNGPFRFVARVPGQRWVFERNPDFPSALGGAPVLRRFIIAVIDEATTKFAGLVSGELDVAGISPAMARLAERDASLRVLEYPVQQPYAIIFNVARPPFDDARVRQAVGLAIDRARIVRVALQGYGVPASGPVPPDHPFALVGSTARDTARADSLLDAAGWRRGSDGLRRRGGHPLAFELLTVGGADNAAEQLIQSDLAAVGVRVEIRMRELAAFLGEARATPRRFDALITGVPGDLSLAYLSAMYDSRLAGGALDYGGYHTARLDSLLARARDAPAPDARAAWADVQRELARESPAVWLYHVRGVQGLSRRLSGVRMDLRGELVTLARWNTTGAATSVALESREEIPARDPNATPIPTPRRDQ